MLDQIELSLVSDGSGAGTVISNRVNGEVDGIGLILSGADPGVTVDITCVVGNGYPEIPILTAYAPGAVDGWVYPRTQLQNIAGANLTAGFVEETPISGKLKMVVSGAGNTLPVRATVVFDCGDD